MPAANTPKSEKFAQLVASGKSLTDAYVESRPNAIMRRTTAHKRASELAQRPDVKARIEELRAPIIKQVQKDFKYTIDTAMAEIELAKVLARALAKPETVLKGIELQCKLAKLLSEGKQKDGSTPLDEATTEELLTLRELVREKKKRRTASDSSVSEKGPQLKVV